MVPPSPNLQPNPQSPKHPNSNNHITPPPRILLPRQTWPSKRRQLEHTRHINAGVSWRSQCINERPVPEDRQALLAKMGELESKGADLEEEEGEEDLGPVGEAAILGL